MCNDAPVIIVQQEYDSVRIALWELTNRKGCLQPLRNGYKIITIMTKQYCKKLRTDEKYIKEIISKNQIKHQQQNPKLIIFL